MANEFIEKTKTKRKYDAQHNTRAGEGVPRRGERARKMEVV
jgi:hypothetical protein